MLYRRHCERSDSNPACRSKAGLLRRFAPRNDGAERSDALSFVERHGLWSEEQKEAAGRLRKIVEEQKLEVDPAVVSRSARHPARQDAGGERGAGLAGERLLDHHHDARQGHLAPHGVSGVHVRRRLRHEGDGGRRRRADGGRSHDVSRAAVGAEHGMAAVRPLFRRRPAGAVRDARISIASVLDQARASAATTSSPASRSNSTSSSSKMPACRRSDAGQPGTPPDVSLLSHGYQYLTEQRYDQMEPVLEIIRRDVLALGLPLRSIEVEFGPSQCEFTFAPTTGLEPADNMVLFRSAVKQIARRHGYHATFMCRPKLPNVFASGWHLHQSLVSRASGENAFMAKDGGEALSPFGRALSRRPAAACPRLGRVHDADHQRLQALPLLFAGAGPRDLGPRQPRRDDPRARRRRTMPRRGWRTASASPPPIPISTWPRRFSPASTASTARSIPARRPIRPTRPRRSCCRRRLREAVVALQRRSVLPRGAGRGVRRLLRPHQERRDRALSGRGVGLGAARIFRDVLKASEPPGLALTAR